MTLEKFTELFKPLTEKWANHFTPSLMEQVYHLVKNAPDKAFEKLCKDLVWNTPFKPPTITEFVEFSRVHSKKIDPIKGTFCDYCGYLGTVTAEDKDGHLWAFRCVCPNAKDVPHQIEIAKGVYRHWPLWNEVRASNHYTRIKPIDRHLKVFSDEERNENWKFLWDVLDKKISKDEIKTRLEIMERTIEIAKENQRGA